MANYYDLTATYGRQYKTAAAAIADWNANKDFAGDFQLGFKPVNKQDLARFDPAAVVKLRYARDTKFTVVKGGGK